jgi:hypothetical protein
VNRDCDRGGYASGSFGGSARVHVAGPKPRTPTSYRQERHINTPGKFRHGWEQVGIAGEIDAGRSRDEDAQRIIRTREQGASAAVFGMNGL